MKIITPYFIAMTATGLLAGAFMYGLLNVVPTCYEVPVNVHLIYRTRLMHHNSTVMQSLMVASIIAPLWYAAVTRHASSVKVLAIVSALLALSSLMITRFGNVSINALIKTWPPDHPPVNWLSILKTWDRYNVARSLSALGCFISFSAAARLAAGAKEKL